MKRNYLDFREKGAASVTMGLIALLTGLAALLLFLGTAEAEFTRQMIDTYHQDLRVIFALVAGLFFSGIALVFDGKLLKYLAFLTNLFALLNFVVFEIDYLGSLFSSIDPTPVTAAFVALLALLGATVLTSLASAILTKERLSQAEGGIRA